jgi:hypothetical protein
MVPKGFDVRHGFQSIAPFDVTNHDACGGFAPHQFISARAPEFDAYTRAVVVAVIELYP